LDAKEVVNLDNLLTFGKRAPIEAYRVQLGCQLAALRKSATQLNTSFNGRSTRQETLTVNIGSSRPYRHRGLRVPGALRRPPEGRPPVDLLGFLWVISAA